MSFDADFIAEAWADLAAEFGEEIVYKPYGGLARTITAIVNRSPPTPPPGATEGVVPKLTVTVENHATRGILLSDYDTGGDLVELAVRAGGTAEERTIGHPLNDDGNAPVFPVY